MDEASDEEQLDREASTRADRFWALGYREGLDQGKEAVLEASFQRGYAEGVQAGRSLGRSQGILTALQALQGKLQGEQAAGDGAVAAQPPLLTPASTDAVCQALLHRLGGAEKQTAEGEQQQQQQQQLEHAHATFKELQARGQALDAVLQQLSQTRQ